MPVVKPWFNNLGNVAKALILALIASLLVVTPKFLPETPAEAAAACPAGLVKPLHGTRVYYDTSKSGGSQQNFTAKYLGYEIDTSVGSIGAATYSLTIPSLNDTSGANKPSTNDIYLDFAPNQPTTETRAISASSKAAVYFLTTLKIPTGVNKNTTAIFQPFAVDVYKNGVIHCTYTDDLEGYRSTLEASANKIYTAQVSQPSTASMGPGSMVYVTVTGNTGTVGSGPFATAEINLVPVAIAAISTFDPAAWQLMKVEYKGKNSSCTKVSNRLYIDKSTTPTSLNCSGVYAANFLFKARSGYTANSNSKIQAFSYIASGQLIKHTSPFTSDINLPKLSSTSSNIVTVDENNLPDLDNVIAQAPIPFTVNDQDFTTALNTAATGPAIVYAGGSGYVNWSPTCFQTGPTTCVTSYNEASTGSWAIESQSDGTKRIRFTPATGFTASWDDLTQPDPRPQITFTLTDTNGATASAIAAVTVLNRLVVNDLYFRTGQGISASSGIPQYGGVQGISWSETVIWNGSAWTTNAVNTSAGTWSIVVSGSQRVFNFHPTANFTGRAFIDFRLTATNSQTASATAYVDVDPAPTVGEKHETVETGKTVTLSVTIDPTGLPQGCLHEVGNSSTCQTTLNGSSYSWKVNSDNTVTFKSDFGYTGSATASFKVTNAYGASGTGTVSVTVVPPNPPTITGPSGTTTTSLAITVSPVVSSSIDTTTCLVHPDNSTCSDEINLPNVGNWKKNPDGTVTFTPASNFTGSANISIRVTDSLGQTGSNTITITVLPPPLTANPATGYTVTTSPKSVTPLVTSPLTLTKCLVDPNLSTSCSNSVTIPGVGQFVLSSGVVTFTAVAGFTGSATVSLRASDSVGQTAEALVTIIVEEVLSVLSNPVPTTSPATSVTTQSATLNGTVEAGASNAEIWFCYSTSSTLSDCVMVRGNPNQMNAAQSGSASVGITGLSASTTYYFKILAFDGTNTYSGQILNFRTDDLPVSGGGGGSGGGSTPTSDPCQPGVTTSSLQPGLYSQIIGFLVNLFASFSTWSAGIFNGVVQSNLAEALTVPNPLQSQAGYEALVQGDLKIAFQATVTFAIPRNLKSAELTNEQIVLAAGPNPGQVEITTTDGQQLSLLSVAPSDNPFLSTTFGGADFNKPEVWKYLGYGQLCWKLEPFGDTDLSYVLPNPIKLPAGTAAGNWRYSNVIVKAGSLTERSDTYQTDTIFYAPAPGTAVWPDINANGIFDPGGRGKDKAISHIIFCVINVATATQSASGTVSPTTSPSPSSSSATPVPSSTSATPTPTPTPTQSTSTPTPTQSTSTPTPTQTQTPTASPTPTPTFTVEACPQPTSSATIAPPGPTPTQSQPVILNITPSPSTSPSPSGTPTPTPTQTTTPTQSPSPSPTPTQTSTPTPSPSGSATSSPTPSPTNSVTPTPTQSSTASPSPTTPGSTPSPTQTTPAPTITPTITPQGEVLCEPNQPNGVALLLSNGLDRLCYQTTTLAFFRAVSVRPAGLEGEGVDELADTGFNIELWLLIASLLGLAGALSLGLARPGRKN